MRLTLVVPDRPPQQPSGGDRYDAALATALRRRSVAVVVAGVPGRWPWPDAQDRRRLAEVLTQAPAGQGGPVLVDGLVASAAPQEVEACAALRPTAVLVHSRLSSGAGAEGPQAEELDRREARALRAADVVVATSQWGARELRAAYGLERVVVAPPGVERADVAPGSTASGAPRLLTLAAVTPVKNHALLLDALALVADRPWTAVCAGPVPDPGHLAALRARASASGVDGRVAWPGAVLGPGLDRLWAETDLLVHPSRSETFGLVVAEAHAHGIPTVVGRGTGAVEALRGDDPRDAPGAVVATDRPDDLARTLRRWLTDPALRRRWRDAAMARRRGLPGWDPTAAVVEQALTGLRVRRSG